MILSCLYFRAVGVSEMLGCRGRKCGGVRKTDKCETVIEIRRTSTNSVCVGSSSLCISADNSENAAEEVSHVYVCLDVETSIQSESNIDI